MKINDLRSLHVFLSDQLYFRADLLSKGTQQAIADWLLTTIAQRKESWWEALGSTWIQPVSLWDPSLVLLFHTVLSPVWPCSTPHWRCFRQAFSQGQTKTTYCMQIRALTVSQNISTMYVLLYVDIRLIIYLIHLWEQVYSGLSLSGCELIFT